MSTECKLITGAELIESVEVNFENSFAHGRRGSTGPGRSVNTKSSRATLSRVPGEGRVLHSGTDSCVRRGVRSLIVGWLNSMLIRQERDFHGEGHLPE